MLWFLSLPHLTMIYNMGLLLVFILSSLAFGAWGYFAGYARAQEVREDGFLKYLSKENRP